MNKLTKHIAGLALSVMATAVMAAPANLVVDNQTDVQSNAYLGENGEIPSPRPTQPHSINRVPWPILRVLCVNHTKNDLCTAIIKMDTAPGRTPVTLGKFTLNMTSGEIVRVTTVSTDYTVDITGPGSVILSKK